jgi:hypothetical protein
VAELSYNTPTALSKHYTALNMSANGYHVSLVSRSNALLTKEVVLSVLWHRARRRIAMGIACLVWGMLKVCTCQTRTTTSFVFGLGGHLRYVYDIITPHGTSVAVIACCFHVNGDTWATTPVTYYIYNFYLLLSDPAI